MIRLLSRLRLFRGDLLEEEEDLRIGELSILLKVDMVLFDVSFLSCWEVGDEKEFEILVAAAVVVGYSANVERELATGETVDDDPVLASVECLLRR